MSSQNVASLNNNKESKSPAKTGAGQSGLVAAATATVTKAVATTPSAVVPNVARVAAVTPPATAGNFDRSVVTSLGK